jgi:hypothetical protein
MTLDHPVRSGLCHGPSCEQKITEKSESRYFCSEGCQGRWSAALVGTKPDPIYGLDRFGGWVNVSPPADGMCSFSPATVVEDVYRVAGSGSCAPPVRPMPPERIEAPWWKPNTWRRSG